jgi:hypothetical protein
MKNCRNLVLVTVCILVMFNACIFPVSSYDFTAEVSPPWLKVGTFVEYEGWEVYFRFIDDREVWSSKEKFVFRWECIAMRGQVATLNITLYIPPKTLESSKMIDVKANTREILDSNGTVLGKACLWLPPNPKEGDRIVVSGKPPNELTAEVRDSGGSSCDTCQGYQELYCIHGGDVDAFVDLDTGLILSGNIDYSTTLKCLGLKEMGLIRLLRATNVDLGPRYLRTEIWAFIDKTLPIWLPTVIFVTATVVIVRKRRKRKQLAKTSKLGT